MKRTAWVGAALVVLALLPASAAASIGPYTGVGRGLLDRFRHIDNHAPDPADHIVTDAKDVYRGRFTYSFSIDAFGTISGTGHGVYRPATWHIEGVNGSNGPFSCDISMTTTEYGVRITGQTSDGEMHVRFALEGARESNEDTPCGAGYTGFASDDTRLANSLELVQPADGLPVSQSNPRISPLRKLENLGDDFDRRVNLHEWRFTIEAPQGPPPVDQGVGAYGTPGAAGRRARVCTIEGTGGRDTINGLGGADIVFGGPGADQIKGGRGKDALYGNAGRDRFAARDGKRDRVTGGAGRDRARVDRRDRVRQVEQVS